MRSTDPKQPKRNRGRIHDHLRSRDRPPRVPDTTPSLPLCLVHVLLPRSWSLYVAHPLLSHLRIINTCTCTVYIFLGSIIVGDYWWKYVAGTIVGIVGIGYVALEFVPSIEPPANMREADVGWGSEQV